MSKGDKSNKGRAPPDQHGDDYPSLGGAASSSAASSSGYPSAGPSPSQGSWQKGGKPGAGKEPGGKESGPGSKGGSAWGRDEGSWQKGGKPGAGKETGGKEFGPGSKGGGAWGKDEGPGAKGGKAWGKDEGSAPKGAATQGKGTGPAPAGVAGAAAAPPAAVEASLLTPRARTALRAACEDHSQETSMGVVDKVVPHTEKALKRWGFASVVQLEVLEALRPEDWSKKLKLPEGLQARVLDRCRAAKEASAGAAAATEEVPEEAPQTAAAPAPAVAAQQEVFKVQLEQPPSAFGSRTKNGNKPIALVANHFLLQLGTELRGANSGVWLTWQVDFPVGTAGADKGKGKGKGKDSNVAPREPGKARRKAAMQELLKGLDTATWLYDGRYRLYTLKSGRKPPSGEQTVDAPGLFSGQVKITPAIDQASPAQKQQEIDLSLLASAQLEADIFEEKRFLNIAIRSYASEQLHLITQGRRIICPDARLLGDRAGQLLKHGRELWFGMLAQVELIDGGMSGRPRCSLNLNLVASVGLPEMSAVDLLARLLAEGDWKHGAEESFRYYKRELESNRWPPEFWGNLFQTIEGETGFRKVRVSTSYLKGTRKASVVGITREPANGRTFEYENHQITVADYFRSKHNIWLKYPDLPCLELTKPGNCVPIELVTVMGGEHNILVGKLRQDYQASVTARTAMDPSKRRAMIEGALKDTRVGPLNSLREKGMNLETSMLELNGHVLAAPQLIHNGRTDITPNGWAGRAQAIAPPQFDVPWALWSFIEDGEAALNGFRETWEWEGSKSGLRFERGEVEWPRNCWSQRNLFSWGGVEEVKAALLEDLLELQRRRRVKLLVVLLPDSGLATTRLRGLLKMLTETEERLADFDCVTQCLLCKKKGPLSGLDFAKQKLKLVMLKVAAKLPLSDDGAFGKGVAHHVQLGRLHDVLAKRRTMVMGADVTHNVVGVSVAGVVATRSRDFATYFSEVRGQAPFAEEGFKTRRRQSEERILDLAEMAEALLKSWQSENKMLPEVILYYRDGVSDGQFVNVLKREHCCLAEAFERVGGTSYKPELVIIVGQKRHQTRFWCKDAPAPAGPASGGKSEGKGKGKGKDASGGKAGGKGKDPSQVPPGTVAGEGIAQPGHLNFFLVAHQGLMGTSVPCHYHVLHLDDRLAKRGFGVDDLERITYDLCHLYSRADKTVSYAAPAYLADHLCERGKLYLETQFADSDEVSSLAPSGSLSEAAEAQLRDAIEKRVGWLNALQQGRKAVGLRGRNYFC